MYQSPSPIHSAARRCAFIMVLSVLGGLTVLASTALAQQIGSRGPFKPTVQDLGMLPAYCRARVMPKNSPDAQRWAATMGKGWAHIHHYCLALQHLNELRVGPTIYSPRQRQSKLKRVVAEIGYVEKRVDPSFPLWNEMMMHKTQASAELAAAGVR